MTSVPLSGTNEVAAKNTPASHLYLLTHLSLDFPDLASSFSLSRTKIQILLENNEIKPFLATRRARAPSTHRVGVWSWRWPHKASWGQLLSLVTTSLSVYHVYILRNCFLGSQTKLWGVWGSWGINSQLALVVLGPLWKMLSLT